MTLAIQDIFRDSGGWTLETLGMWVTVLGIGPVLKVDPRQDPESPRVPEPMTSPIILGVSLCATPKTQLRLLFILVNKNKETGAGIFESSSVHCSRF